MNYFLNALNSIQCRDDLRRASLAHELPQRVPMREPSARLYFTDTVTFLGFTDSSLGIVIVRTPFS